MLKIKSVCSGYSVFLYSKMISRGGSRTAATSTMEHFVIIVNDWKTLTIIIKSFILDVSAVLDPPLIIHTLWSNVMFSRHKSFECDIVNFMHEQILSRITNRWRGRRGEGGWGTHKFYAS